MKKNVILSLLLSTSILLSSSSCIAFAGPGDLPTTDSSNTVDKDDNSDEIPVEPNENANLIQSKKMIIKSVSCDQTSVTPGRPFTLTVKVKNMTSDKLYKVALNIGITSNTEHKQPFIPVGTTNEIYVGTIDAWKEKDISITLVSNPKIETGTYSFNTNLLFNSPGDKQEIISQVSGITVENPTSLEIRDVSVSLGGGSMIIGSIYNKSDNEITDVKVNATINGEDYFANISNIDAEDEMDFEIWIPESTEDRVASLNASYTNAKGEEVSASSEIQVFGADSSLPEGDFSEDLNVKPSLWERIKSWLGFGA